MSQELFERVVNEAVEAGGDRIVVFLSNYNEPSFDPLFEDRVRFLFARKLAVSILTNASGFTPERCALFESLGKFRYIGVNLPTLRPDRYEKLHGTRDLARVIANVEAMQARDISEETAIVALGEEDDEHRRDVEELRAHFEPRGWTVKPFKIRSRPDSGTYVVEPPPIKNLRGCELMGSRPFEHLHVTATGTAVLCCQDYYEKLSVGNVKTQSVAEILAATRWRSCGAGRTASRKRPTTSSAGAASSRSAAEPGRAPAPQPPNCPRWWSMCLYISRPHSSPVMRPKKECCCRAAASRPSPQNRSTRPASRSRSRAKSRSSRITNVGSVGEPFEKGLSPRSPLRTNGPKSFPMSCCLRGLSPVPASRATAQCASIWAAVILPHCRGDSGDRPARRWRISLFAGESNRFCMRGPASLPLPLPLLPLEQ